MEKSSAAKKPVVRPSHRKAAEAFLHSVDGPFRRSGLSKVMHPMTSPRSLTMADQLADSLMQVLAKAGKIQRQGHLHWVKVSKERALRGGGTVPELAQPASLLLTTRCPDKWLSLDLEIGELWAGSAKGWRRATPAQRQDALACLE